MTPWGREDNSASIVVIRPFGMNGLPKVLKGFT